MSRQFKITIPKKSRLYDNEAKAAAYFLDIPLASHELAVLTDYGDVVAVRYGGDGTIKVYGRANLTAFSSMVRDNGRSLIIEDRARDYRTTFYFVKILAGQEAKS